MNPLPMVWADLKAMRLGGLIAVGLIALAVALGVAVGAQERALRQASARAADDFPLVIGAPGSDGLARTCNVAFATTGKCPAL